MEEKAPGETIIVDGYNLLHRCFPPREGEDLRGCRERLEVRLREFQRSQEPGTAIILVYDGAEEMSAVALAMAVRPDPMFRIVFSLPPRSADDEIVDECRRRVGREKLTVVTSDRKDIAKALRGWRLRIRSSEEFADILDDSMRRAAGGGAPGRSKGHSAEKPSPDEIAPSEVDEWVKIFSQPLPRRKGGRRPGPGGGGPRR
jgi:predicted RNA-binding protein with PIN domain